ncbi:sn-glycerol-3-phosphate-binding periplasmic protein UgpB [Paenibacillus solanacearum]|uniref:Sn-glycerol-3-phosphate-binding periplasmic protein UgpB n=1 Tax=Paenibacillus solanacearum TaxID=2048548 RepID=A0A916K4D3_9BACL|nr:ABC transporter substrate-binding protein [Paenibacillus solanacearum]CAG7635207.1 sn-glycerol-3-phosphate-binding periplasmic protein UgpB [Paenibacillus solanacearum]
MRAKLAAVLVAVWAAAVLSGCGTDSGYDRSAEGRGGDPAEDIIEMSFYYPVDVGGPLTPTIESMVGEFMEANPKVKVRPVYTGNYDDTTVKTEAAIQGKNPPDVAILRATELFTLLDMDAIVPLDEFISQEQGSDYLSDFYPALLANAQTGGKTYGIPFQRSTVVLYYNKDAFAAAGLDPGRPPETWEQLAAMAKQLTRPGRWGIEIPSSAPTVSTWMLQALALQNGRNLMSEDGKAVYYDTAENRESLQYWLDLSRKHQAMPASIIDWETAPRDFLQGKTAMMFHTTGNLANVKLNAPFDFGVSAPPKNKRLGTPTGGGNFFIFKGIPKKNQEAAWKFIKWMTEPERVAKWSIDTGYVAVRKSAYETESMKQYIRAFPAALVGRQQLHYAQAELSTHNNDRVTKALSDGIQRALTGKAAPEEALRTAQEEADRALAPFASPVSAGSGSD